jgi:SAM-dependent methyltransferase
MNTYGGFASSEILAELYDEVDTYRNRPDIEYYVSESRETEGSILELGCGTGRILIPIAEAGGDIAGLDLSAHMLSRCTQNMAALPDDTRGRIRLVRSSMVQFAFNTTFDLILIPFHAFQHLISVDEQMSCLRHAHQHLSSTGRLIFDVFHVKHDLITNPEAKKERGTEPDLEISGGRRMRFCGRVVSFHPSEQYNEVELIFYVTGPDGTVNRHTRSFPMRYFFRYELEHLLARCGFEIIEMYGSFDRGAFVDDSPEMIVVAGKN